jgi:hypothetical protein
VCCVWQQHALQQQQQQHGCSSSSNNADLLQFCMWWTSFGGCLSTLSNSAHIKLGCVQHQAALTSI